MPNLLINESRKQTDEKIEQERKMSVSINPLTRGQEDVLVGLRMQIDEIDSDRAAHEAQKYAKGEGNHAYIAMDNSTPAGYIEIAESEKPDPQSADLDSYQRIARIGVLEKYRGKGIARQLLSHAEQQAQKKDAKGLWLDCLETNLPAVETYRKAGYSEKTRFAGDRGER